MVVFKWSDKVEVSAYIIYSPLCGGLYKEEEDSLFSWSVIDTYAKMNCFTCSKEGNDQIFPEDQYNEQFKNCRGNIHNGRFQSQTLKEKRKIEDTCSKYAGSAKFNVIPREGNPSIQIKSYRDQCCEHMISNGIFYVLSLPDPHNKEKKWDLLLHQSRFPLD